MSYLNVISLAEAKNYLRVDDDLTDDDNQITNMIKSSLSYLERETNYIFFAREKSYLFQDYCVRVYDSPINSVTSPSTGLTTTNKTLYTLYETNNSEDTTLTLNVGYSDVNDVPSELIDAGLSMIELYYYQSKQNESGKLVLPQFIKDTINKYRRFIL